ncbi:amidohydrolase family protein, partial [bacterium]|nr:amidohydrolase family protein [bacterium]
MAELTLTETTTNSIPRTKPSLIDCDIHNAPQSTESIRKHLPDRWKEHHRKYGARNYTGSYYPRAVPNAARHDAWPPSGLPPGSDLDFMREQLLDKWGIEYGVLNCLIGAGGQLNLEYGAAFSRAVNDWQIAEFLDPEPRLKGSIIVPYEAGDLSAEEIDRVGSHPSYVQVLFAVRTSEPMGRRKYWPIYEAAQRNDLPVGVHFGGAGGGPITGSGWPSHYTEDHCG